VLTVVRSVSPELVLVDPELARWLRDHDEETPVDKEDDGMHDVNGVNGNGNGAVPASAPPPAAAPIPEGASLDSRLFDGGFIDAEQRNAIIHEHATTGAPVEGIVRARGLVHPEVLDRLLGRPPQPQQQQPLAAPAPAAPQTHAPIELVPTAFAPPAEPLAPAAVEARAPVEAQAPVQVVAAEPVAVVEAAVVEAAAVAAPEPAPVATTPEPVLAAVPAPAVEAAPAPAVAAEAAPVVPVQEPVAAMPVAVVEPVVEVVPEPAPVLAAVETPVEEKVAETRPVVFDVLVRLTDGHELHATSHATVEDAQAAARALTESGEWLDTGDALVQRPAVSAVEVRPRLTHVG
jgi:hypothetical protein